MIDIHAHILPGIDDGARDIDDTLEMAEIAVEGGVTEMIVTPHCNLPDGFGVYFDDEYITAFRYAAREIERAGIPLKLYPGMEVFASYELPKLLSEGRVMTLNESRYLLVEFDFDEEEEYASGILSQIQRMKAVPVVAHAERYRFVQEHPQIVREWRRQGVCVQINKGSYLGSFGRRAERTAWLLTDQKLVTAVASDTHGPDMRTPYMKEAYQELLAQYPKEYAQALVEDYPRRILEDRPIIWMEEEGEQL